MAPPIFRTLISLSLNRSTRLQKPTISSYYLSVAFFSSSTPAPSIDFADHFIKEHKFSPEVALKAASYLNYLKKPDKCDEILSFFKKSGFSVSQIEEAVKRKPTLLSGSLDKTIKPKFKVFKELGFSPHDIADLVSTDPWFLTRSTDDRIKPSVSILKDLLGSNAGVVRLLKTTSWFLRSNLEKSMVPNIEFLVSCGIGLPQIVKYVFTFPRFFLHKPENIKHFVKRADEMGFNRKSNLFLAAIRTLSSMSEETWEHKLNLLWKLGFSEDDIGAAFRRAPQAFAVSERKIKEVTECLLSSKRIDMSFIIRHPEVFIYSVEQRLKPRLMVIEVLESKDLLWKEPRFSTLFKISAKQFQEKYVLPYLTELQKASVDTVGL
ncbi:Mitochodrial transcription termination factor-related protein [Corchorus capsularis]|uniref:Mitochodrial transcription termination factor-related protein n=1 Tax=Corchorus capsularis TaxID=210143 RepID=A0A1R3J4M4_COCAP|nr:Mitochodrial transcription termination factor-related protein [Corchorus capsularis]